MMFSQKHLAVVATACLVVSWATQAFPGEGKDVPGEPRTDSLVEYELFRTMPAEYERTTLRLFVRPKRAGVAVSARCHVCDGGADLGRFPLQRLEHEPGKIKLEKDDGRLTFRIECLAEKFLKESYISLSISDEQSGKPLSGVRVWLKDAVIRKTEGKTKLPAEKGVEP